MLYLEVINLLRFVNHCCWSFSNKVEKLITGILLVAFGKACLATDVIRLSCFSMVLGSNRSSQLFRPTDNTTFLTFWCGCSFSAINLYCTVPERFNSGQIRITNN